jgi:hypothetical protein
MQIQIWLQNYENQKVWQLYFFDTNETPLKRPLQL